VNDNEEWRTVLPMPNYEVSSLGNVRNKTTGKILRPWDNGDGYLRYTLRKPSPRYRPTGHVLVCEAFNGPKPTPQHKALHRDDVKKNNIATNIYWGTPKQNAEDARLNGRLRGKGITEEQQASILRMKEDGLRISDISELENIRKGTIGKFLSRNNQESIAA
jgi:hypothetical protein